MLFVVALDLHFNTLRLGVVEQEDPNLSSPCGSRKSSSVAGARKAVPILVGLFGDLGTVAVLSSAWFSQASLVVSLLSLPRSLRAYRIAIGPAARPCSDDAWKTPI